MARIGRIISFISNAIRKNAKVSQVKINQSANNTAICDHFSDIGDDSYPLNTDYPIIVDIERSGGYSVVGYIDPINQRISKIGEKRIYARKSDGSVICDIYLKNTGEVEIKNENGNFKLLPNGEFNLNGARITTNGDVITASGISLDNHVHLQNDGNDSGGGVNTNPSSME